MSCGSCSAGCPLIKNIYSGAGEEIPISTALSQIFERCPLTSEPFGVISSPLWNTRIFSSQSVEFCPSCAEILSGLYQNWMEFLEICNASQSQVAVGLRQINQLRGDVCVNVRKFDRQEKDGEEGSSPSNGSDSAKDKENTPRIKIKKRPSSAPTGNALQQKDFNVLKARNRFTGPKSKRFKDISEEQLNDDPFLKDFDKGYQDYQDQMDLEESVYSDEEEDVAMTGMQLNEILSSKETVRAKELIFSHIKSVKDLTSCREVCRLWNEAATPHLVMVLDKIQIPFAFREEKYRKMLDDNYKAGVEYSSWSSSISRRMSLATINASPEERPETPRPETPSDHLEMFKKGHKLREHKVKHLLVLSLLPEYLEYLDGGPALVFSNFYFDNLLMNQQLSVDFFGKCGPTLKKLDLQLNHRSIKPFFMDSVTFVGIFLHCPNLEEFVLRSLPADAMKPVKMDFTTRIKKLRIYTDLLRPIGYSSGFLPNLLSICPLLEGFYYQQGLENLEDTKVLKALSKSPFLSTLKELSLQNVNGKVLSILLSKEFSQMKLKWLKFRSLLVDGVEMDLKKFLLSQSDTLEQFFVYEWNKNLKIDVTYNISFPVMPKLSVLRIGGDSMVHFAVVKWPEVFPSLRRLILKGDAGLARISTSLTDPHEKLQALELTAERGVAEMQDLGKTFPNVKELIIGNQSDQSLRQIWTLWPELETLYICTNPHVWTEGHAAEFLGLDQLFTGLSEAQCKKSLKRDSTTRRKIGQNITNLKKLRELTIHPGAEKDIWNGEREDKVTDASVYEAFCKLKELQYIKIWDHEITRQGADYLCKSIPGLRRNESEEPFFQLQKNLDYKPHPLYQLDGEANYEK